MLLSSEGEGLPRFLDHLAHFADAFGALGLALMLDEDVARTRRARLDGRGDVTFAKTVAVADVQGGEPTQCEWFAIATGMRRMQVVRMGASLPHRRFSDHIGFGTGGVP